MRPELTSLALGDAPDRWEALGFVVQHGTASVGNVALRLGATGHGIVGWAVTGVSEPVDGLASIDPVSAVAAQSHPNRAIGIDHVVVATPDFDRTAVALERAGLPLTRTREAPGGVRQGFRRLGPAILELVMHPGVSTGPAQFWGLVVVVEDLEALADRLGDRLGSIKEAVQPGRRIATLRREAGLQEAVAFMDPEPG
jgi:hypothetical protein